MNGDIKKSETEDHSDFFRSGFVYAVIGASQNPEKFGFKVFEFLRSRGFLAYPVNPKGGTILDADVARGIRDIPESVDVVVFVTPPGVSNLVLRDVVDAGIRRAWFQPGSSDGETDRFCAENGITQVREACIMRAVEDGVDFSPGRV